MVIRHSELDAFVEESDALGGPVDPRVQSLWAGFRYEPAIQVGAASPDSAEYFAQMMKLYEEISGRTLDQKTTEMTRLDVDWLVGKESPLAGVMPKDRALHYLRLARAVRAADLPKGARVLDMGCGWGMSSELLAQLGCEVHAVDINPLFVDLVARRARRLDLKIEVEVCAFDDFRAQAGSYDAILFYECLHHAVRPLELLSRLSGYLKPAGKLLLAGEPIQADYWPAWGLRLDALSVYCIRKFGWFESGWSQPYLMSLIARSNLLPKVLQDPDPAIGRYVVASKNWRMTADDMELNGRSDWWAEGEYLISNRAGRESVLELYRPQDAAIAVLEMCNFGVNDIPVQIEMGGTASEVVLAPGENIVRLELPMEEHFFQCNFSATAWCPAIVLGTGDVRNLGFHLRQITFERQQPDA
ncbi:MAG: class I SAM-dependent methyltransferase [Pseudomonadota bacterium]